MPRVAGGQHAPLPRPPTTVVAPEDAPRKCFCEVGGGKLFEGTAWGPRVCPAGGGGKRCGEKAKLLFPRHFLHLHYRQWCLKLSFHR